MAGNEENSGTTSPTTRNISSSQNLQIIKPKGHLAVQLDEDNYLLWKYQIETAIRGYGLDEYINGMLIIPPKMVKDDKDNMIPNSEYSNYLKQDSLLASWIMSSVSLNILSQIVGCKSSSDIWEAIE